MSKNKSPEVEEKSAETPASAEDKGKTTEATVESNVAEEKNDATVEETPMTKEEELQAQIEQLTKERDELSNKFLRQYAEFDNYRKRTNKERFELMKTAAQSTIASLLPVIDDFDRAKKAGEDDDNVEPLSEGMLLVYEKLKNILAQKGLKEMVSTGVKFNPDLHNALTEVPVDIEEMKGMVIDTIEKGYFLGEKIIRHARVVVGK